MSTIKYQPEIDGIRAIAVISVVLFHLEYKFIPGGFVGVDVFFVISGFLITRILYRDTKEGQFSFSQFYRRRIRRLAPALIAVLLLTFLVASVFVIPNHFQRFSGALLASVFSVSNIFFWLESGYFDASADLKPLLHTWSLSVEEQFYLMWPALIFFCRGLSQRQLILVFIGLSVVSALAAKLFTVLDPTASFFLMPFRVYEFGLGAILALTLYKNDTQSMALPNWLKELLCVSGLGLIVFSLLSFDKSTPFPDLYALVPCIGAVLLIGACDARLMGWVLRNPVSVWLGKISYSLYLVHWPIVVLYKHITFEDVVVGKTRIALLLITLCAGFMLYRLVENRFRYPSNNHPQSVRKSTLMWLLIPIGLVAVSAHAYQSNGWAGRFDKAVINAIGDIEAKQLIRRRYLGAEDAIANQPFDGVNSQGNPPQKILLMGDSHTNDMFNALYLNLKENTEVSIRRIEIEDTCLYLFTETASNQSQAAQKRCEFQFERLQNTPLLNDVDKVILSMRWERPSLAFVPAFVEFLQQWTDDIVLMGRTAEFKNVPALVIKNGLNETIETQLAAARMVSLDKLNQELSELAHALELDFVDKVPHLCPSPDYCDVVDTSGLILYTDYGHWTLEGAKFFGDRMLSVNEVRKVLIEPNN